TGERLIGASGVGANASSNPPPQTEQSQPSTYSNPHRGPFALDTFFSVRIRPDSLENYGESIFPVRNRCGFAEIEVAVSMKPRQECAKNGPTLLSDFLIPVTLGSFVCHFNP